MLIVLQAAEINTFSWYQIKLIWNLIIWKENMIVKSAHR